MWKNLFFFFFSLSLTLSFPTMDIYNLFNTDEVTFEITLSDTSTEPLQSYKCLDLCIQFSFNSLQA